MSDTSRSNQSKPANPRSLLKAELLELYEQSLIVNTELLERNSKLTVQVHNLNGNIITARSYYSMMAKLINKQKAQLDKDKPSPQQQAMTPKPIADAAQERAEAEVV